MTTEVTQILKQLADGDKNVADALLPLVYEQLCAIARQRMSDERPDHTLQATALVHEAYARLVGNDEIAWNSRGHFFIASAEAMRRILVEHSRARARQKRGGPPADRRRVPLSVVDLAQSENLEEILILDEALCRLSEMSQKMADVVHLRFFAGLSIEETAKALGISTPTVKRRWTWARAWLYREMKDEDSPDDSREARK
jgi:RNA polymerase sigma factor (TIGR02999 family)